MNDYDMVVIGAGPAGYAAAIRASQLGKNTAIIDQQWLGGVCLKGVVFPPKRDYRTQKLSKFSVRVVKNLGFPCRTWN